MGVLLVIANGLDALIGPGVMLLFPLYASMRAIESPSILNDQQWLTYWIIYSFLTLFELSFNRILVRLPFWPYVKLLFCMWLVLPMFNGAAYIYENYMRKYIKIGGIVSSDYPEDQRKVLQMMSFDAWRSVAKYIQEHVWPAIERAIRTVKSHISFKSNKKNIDQSTLLCCKIFISETRNCEILNTIEQAARLNTETAIVNKAEDQAYNRVRYTLVSYVVHDATGKAIYSPLQQTIVAMAEAAYGAINLESHSGAHPRLGVVDDILFHPLARATLDDAAWLAKAVAVDMARRFQVPVYLYAAAHPTGKALDVIRRELGYYKPNFMGDQWAGWTLPEILPERPNEGPNLACPSRGVVTIGARPWVALYNIPIKSNDISATRKIARKVSARGGGLPTVQTLGLAHGEDSTEVACMLLKPNEVGADKVQSRVEMLAAEEGLGVEKGYFTDFPPEMIIEKYMNLISN